MRIKGQMQEKHQRLFPTVSVSTDGDPGGLDEGSFYIVDIKKGMSESVVAGCVNNKKIPYLSAGWLWAWSLGQLCNREYMWYYPYLMLVVVRQWPVFSSNFSWITRLDSTIKNKARRRTLCEHLREEFWHPNNQKTTPGLGKPSAPPDGAATTQAGLLWEVMRMEGERRKTGTNRVRTKP